MSWQISKYFSFPVSERPLKSDCAFQLAARAFVTESMEGKAVAALVAKLQPVCFAKVTLLMSVVTVRW